jgi:hypothetical protein
LTLRSPLPLLPNNTKQRPKNLGGFNILLTIMCDSLLMLQVWKIKLAADPKGARSVNGWVLAHTAKEARSLSGVEEAIVQRKPEHLWIAKDRVIWEKPSDLSL